MRKSVLLLAVSLVAQVVFCGNSFAAGMTIKKASAVSEAPKQSGMEAGLSSNLIGTAVNLFTGLQALKAQSEELTRSCAPSAADVEFVNKMVKEYAKIGQETRKEFWAELPPKEKLDGCTFKETAINGGDKGSLTCYDAFDESTDKGNVWQDYPKASVELLCPKNKGNDCAEKDKLYYSNIYKIYGVMNWSEADLLSDELSVHSHLMTKAEECDPEIVNRKKREMTGALVTSTISGIGQKQNTAATMQQVGGLIQGMGANGGGMGNTITTMGAMALPSLLGGATQ